MHTITWIKCWNVHKKGQHADTVTCKVSTRTDRRTQCLAKAKPTSGRAQRVHERARHAVPSDFFHSHKAGNCNKAAKRSASVPFQAQGHHRQHSRLTETTSAVLLASAHSTFQAKATRLNQKHKPPANLQNSQQCLQITGTLKLFHMKPIIWMSIWHHNNTGYSARRCMTQMWACLAAVGAAAAAAAAEPLACCQSDLVTGLVCASPMQTSKVPLLTAQAPHLHLTPPSNIQQTPTLPKSTTTADQPHVNSPSCELTLELAPMRARAHARSPSCELGHANSRSGASSAARWWAQWAGCWPLQRWTQSCGGVTASSPTLMRSFGSAALGLS